MRKTRDIKDYEFYVIKYLEYSALFMDIPRLHYSCAKHERFAFRIYRCVICQNAMDISSPCEN